MQSESKKFIGLSNDEILTIMNYPEYDEEVDMIDFARAIEQALKEKNHVRT